MSHPYLLVFDFAADSPLTSADIEDDIAEAVGNAFDDPSSDHLVDGNEIGDTVSIFVYTRDPMDAFRRCQDLFQRQGLLDTLTAKYRSMHGDEWFVIHSPRSQRSN